MTVAGDHRINARGLVVTWIAVAAIPVAWVLGIRSGFARGDSDLASATTSESMPSVQTAPAITQPRTGRPGVTRLDPYVLVSVALAIWAVGVVVQHTWAADFLLHVATVKSMARDLGHPPDPMVGSGYGSPYYSPYILLAAILVRVTALSPTAVFCGLALVNMGLLLWAFRRFCGWFTSSWGATFALLATLFLWGLQPPVWSGFLSMRSLAEVLPYPSTLAFSLMLLVWDQLLRYRGRPAHWRLAVLALLAAMIALVHSFTALATAIGAIAILVAYRSQWRGRDLLGIAVAGLGALLLVLAWPYSSLAELFSAGPELTQIHRRLLDDMIDPHQLSFVYGLFGVVPMIARLRASRTDPLAVMFGLSAAVIVAAVVTSQYEFLRVVPVVMLAGHVALGAFIANAGSASVEWRRGLAAIVALVLVAGMTVDITPLNGFVAAVPITWLPRSMQSMAHTPSLAGPSHQFDFVASYLPPGSTVLADTNSSDRLLNWLGYYTVNPGWPDPWLADGAQRTKDRITFLRSGTSPAVRAEILARYRARCALITATPSVAAPGAVSGFHLVRTWTGGALLCA
ncbi:MAG: hypothetical protein ACM3JP_02445 [Betaproteobacteria bacterium]